MKWWPWSKRETLARMVDDERMDDSEEESVAALRKETAQTLREETVQTRTHRLSQMPPEELDGVFQALMSSVDEQAEQAKELTKEAGKAKREAKRIVTKTSSFRLTDEERAEIEAVEAMIKAQKAQKS